MALVTSLARAAAAWALTALFCTTLALSQALAFKRLPVALVQKAVRWWGRSTLALLGIRLELVNASTVEDRAPRVFVCNHQSALDMVWIAAVTPPAALAIGKKELAWIPFINLAWWGVDFMLIDRANARRAAAVLEAAAREIVLGRRSLLIAPEGTRSRDGSMGPFKRGAFRLAIRSQAPVCPVVVSGAFELMPRQAYLARPGTIRLKFLPEFPTRGLSEADAHGLGERVRDAMLQAYETLDAPSGPAV